MTQHPWEQADWTEARAQKRAEDIARRHSPAQIRAGADESMDPYELCDLERAMEVHRDNARAQLDSTKQSLGSEFGIGIGL